MLDQTGGTNVVLNLKIDAGPLVAERRCLSTHCEHSQLSTFLDSAREKERK